MFFGDLYTCICFFLYLIYLLHQHLYILSKYNNYKFQRSYLSISIQQSDSAHSAWQILIPLRQKVTELLISQTNLAVGGN